MLFEARIQKNENLRENYFRIDFATPLTPDDVAPGQFVHVAIPGLQDRLLRRPFSVCDISESGVLSVVYKVVGAGTSHLAELSSDESCGILGPLGQPFTPPMSGETPVIVAGGYGAAATYILAKRSPSPGKLLLGARTQRDLLMRHDFEDLGFEVMVATDDGSEGVSGLVTDLLREELADESGGRRFYGCGPEPMLMAMARILDVAGTHGEISLDQLMCCGVGACFACVAKVKDSESKDGWRYARTCVEGPVFDSRNIVT